MCKILNAKFKTLSLTTGQWEPWKVLEEEEEKAFLGSNQAWQLCSFILECYQLQKTAVGNDLIEGKEREEKERGWKE